MSILCEVRNSKDEDYDNPKPHLAQLEVKLPGGEQFHPTCIYHLAKLIAPYEVRELTPSGVSQ